MTDQKGKKTLFADPRNFERIVAQFGHGLATTLRALAAAASDAEWEKFVASGFDSRHLPPVALSRRDMEALHGGALRAAARALTDFE